VAKPPQGSEAGERSEPAPPRQAGRPERAASEDGGESATSGHIRPAGGGHGRPPTEQLAAVASDCVGGPTVAGRSPALCEAMERQMKRATQSAEAGPKRAFGPEGRGVSRGPRTDASGVPPEQ